jgi:predicted phosphodiesterase
MNIKEINIINFPVIIISDTHTNLANIRAVRSLYPNNQVICLGDITFLFAKPGGKFNSQSIQYFIDNKIPCLEGNHDQYVLNETKFIHDVTTEQLKFLKKLPTGFKLILPDGRHYLLFHHLPNDIWGHKFKGDLSQGLFLDSYPIDEIKTIDVIHGHCHENFIEEYPYINQRRICVGQLCNKSHHNNGDSGGNYLLITDKGVEFKTLYVNKAT